MKLRFMVTYFNKFHVKHVKKGQLQNIHNLHIFYCIRKEEEINNKIYIINYLFTFIIYLSINIYTIEIVYIL